MYLEVVNLEDMSLKGGAAQAATALLEAGLVALESSNSKLAMHHVSATAPLIGHLIVEVNASILRPLRDMIAENIREWFLLRIV